MGYAFAAALMQIRPAERLCDAAGTTIAVNACLAEKLKRANDRLGLYLQAALHRYGSPDEAAVRGRIETSEKAFEAYRSAECEAVYEAWTGGTIRGAMDLGCQIDMTDSRTHEIWRHWLEYVDSTPPLLPEPEPTK